MTLFDRDFRPCHEAVTSLSSIGVPEKRQACALTTPSDNQDA